MEIIKRKIEQVRRRLRILILFDKLVIGLSVSLVAICLYLSMDKFAHWLWVPWQVITLFVGVGMLIGLVLFFHRHISQFEAAVCIDEQMKLKERITSALEFADQSNKSPLVPKLIDDAVRHAEKINAKHVLPLRPPKYFQYLAGLVVLAVILGFVPYYHAEQRQAQLATIKNIKMEGKKLEELSKKLGQEAQGQNMKEVKNVAKKLEEVGKALQQPKIDEKEALAKLAKLQEQLRKTQEKMPTEKGMRDTLRKMAKAGKGNLGKLGESLKEGKMQAAQAQLEELKKKLAKGELSKNEMKELAKDLKKMKGSLKDTQTPGLEKSIGDLAKAMEAGDVKDAQAAAELSQKELAELQKSFKEAEKMENAIDAAEASKKSISGYCATCNGPCQGKGPG